MMASIRQAEAQGVTAKRWGDQSGASHFSELKVDDTRDERAVNTSAWSPLQHGNVPRLGFQPYGADRGAFSVPGDVERCLLALTCPWCNLWLQHRPGWISAEHCNVEL